MDAMGKLCITLVKGFLLSLVLVMAVALYGCGDDDCDLEIETNALPNGTVGALYAFELQSDCGGDYWFLEEGSLPPGIGLEDDGDLIGVPTLAGTYVFTIGVWDSFWGNVAFKGFSLTVN